MRDCKILAKCQDNDYTEKTSVVTEPQNSPPPSPPSSNPGSRRKREKQGKNKKV
jgi:cell division protease FtsH